MELNSQTEPKTKSLLVLQLRSLLIGLAMLIAGCSSTPDTARTEKSKTFVLVHGAWVGEWSWEPVAAILRSSGHQVYNVSLKGQGKRRSEHSPDITLEDHIRDVVRVIEENNLTDVYLASHSYGGKVATGAWDRTRSRIHHVIFVDGFAPVLDGKDPFHPYPARRERASDAKGDEMHAMIPFPNPNAAIAAKTVPMPVATLAAPLHLEKPLPVNTLRSFVFAGNNRRGSTPTPFETKYYQPILASDAWIAYRLPTYWPQRDARNAGSLGNNSHAI